MFSGEKNGKRDVEMRTDGEGVCLDGECVDRV